MFSQIELLNGNRLQAWGSGLCARLRLRGGRRARVTAGGRSSRHEAPESDLGEPVVEN